MVANVVGFVLGGFLLGFSYLVRRIPCVTPSFLRGALGLIDNSLIGHFLIANGFADPLLSFAHDLINFARRRYVGKVLLTASNPFRHRLVR
jgi:hypothetical protein